MSQLVTQVSVEKVIRCPYEVADVGSGRFLAVCEILHGIASGDSPQEATENLKLALAEIYYHYPDQVEARLSRIGQDGQTLDVNVI